MTSSSCCRIRRRLVYMAPITAFAALFLLLSTTSVTFLPSCNAFVVVQQQQHQQQKPKRNHVRSSSSQQGPSSTLLLNVASSSSSSGIVSGEQQQRQQQQQGDDEKKEDNNFSKMKEAGCGNPFVPSGNRELFDPAVEGKLGGTADLDNRIAQGSSHQLPHKMNTYYYLDDADDAQRQQEQQQQPSLSGTTGRGAEQQRQGQDATGTQHNTGTDQELQDCQHWLEDIGDAPTNFARPTKPVTATVLGRARLIDENAPGDIQHVLLQLPEGFHYTEGQSLSVIPPGTDPKTNKAYKPRLYSIASTRYGDLLDGRTVSLCVRRAQYFDPVTQENDPAKAGVCSGFLCDVQKGDSVKVAGPVGKTMLLPKDPSKDIIMVATGTGIAPFRGFLHRLFMENTVARHMFTGKAWLILGVPVTGGLLYPAEFEAMKKNAAAQSSSSSSSSSSGPASSSLEVTYAISREMQNAKGGKLYVQDVLSERADELFERLDDGAVIYFCGLKGMMPGILQALERVAVERGLDWNAKLKELQANHQWHVEVY